MIAIRHIVERSSVTSTDLISSKFRSSESRWTLRVPEFNCAGGRYPRHQVRLAKYCDQLAALERTASANRFWSRKKPLLMSWPLVKDFNTKSQPPGFGSTGRAYLQIDDITIGAVHGSFRSHTSLAVHRILPNFYVLNLTRLAPGFWLIQFLWVDFPQLPALN